METDRENKTNSMGTLAWGEDVKGVVSSKESARLRENLEFVVTQEQLDAERRRMGLLNPTHIAIETLLPPDSAMAVDALKYAEQTHVLPLLRHSWRTYYFGALIARHDGIEFDREIFFTAAILHDIGLTQSANIKSSCCCFAVSGGLQVRERLIACGHDRTKAGIVGDAISLHLNLHVPLEEHGPAAFLVARGAVCDVFGPGVSRMSTESTKEVLARYSREGMSEVIGPGIHDHLAGTRPDVITTVLFVAAKQRPQHSPDSQHPLDCAPFI